MDAVLESLACARLLTEQMFQKYAKFYHTIKFLLFIIDNTNNIKLTMTLAEFFLCHTYVLPSSHRNNGALLFNIINILNSIHCVFKITNPRKNYCMTHEAWCAIIILRVGHFQYAMDIIQYDFYYTESPQKFSCKKWQKYKS